MTFDPDFKPASKETVSPHIAALMDRAFYSRRPRGLNVQWLREDGARDEWSFANADNRDLFIAKLQRDATPHAISF